MTRLFFDISDIAIYIRKYRSISGIQRVTVMIVSEITRQLGPDKVYLAWHRAPGTPYLASPATDLLDALRHFDTATLGQALGVPVAEHVLYSAAQILPSHPTPSWAYADADAELATLDAVETGTVPATRHGTPFFELAKQGDILCGLGRSWGQPHLEDSYREAKRRGISVHLLVHDLIPLKLPQLANPGSSSDYYTWLSRSPAYCCSYLANSRATGADLRDFLQELDARCPVHVTPLAQERLIEAPTNLRTHPDIPLAHARALSHAQTAARLSLPVREAMTVPYVLCVGTIEPRKNLWRLVQAWSRLTREPTLEMPRLVLAGRRGWLTDGFLEMLERTGGMGGWVVHLNAPTDEELDYLYRHCLFIAKVSLYEGWGLPIGEGLSYGKTGVVSHTSSMPEVGGDMVEYCDPTATHSIADACRKLLAAPEHRLALEERIARTRLRGWEDVAQDVLKVLLH
jgi:glycosyltransferase involved in cell wall biosynthesis